MNHQLIYNWQPRLLLNLDLAESHYKQRIEAQTRPQYTSASRVVSFAI